MLAARGAASYHGASGAGLTMALDQGSRRSGMALYNRLRPRRRVARSRRASARTYSLADLLARQPRTVQKVSEYAMLRAYLENSPELRRVRVTSRTFAALNSARIGPDNLENYFRTRRLPRHPFVPTFLTVKSRYVAHRARLAAERKRYIMERMRALPTPVVDLVRYLGYLEEYYSTAGAHPVWQRNLFPATKKKVDEYARLTPTAWIGVFRTHLELLEKNYRMHSTTTTESLIACFVLEMVPTRIPSERVPPESVKSRYRLLSLRHHPDRGGDAAAFRAIKAARDVLLSSDF